MAEDGLLLNFSVPESIGHKFSTPKFRGGSWRDRVRLKKQAKGLPRPPGQDGPQPFGPEAAFQRTLRGTKGGSNAEQISSVRPAKRQKIDTDPARSDIVNRHDASKRDLHHRKSYAEGQREVISSLFTFNPVPQSTGEARGGEEQSTTPATPSNAPLPDGAHTFVSLGLSPSLASHLITRMSLKNPTAIQRAAITQLVHQDTDAFIQSETGSGKTLAYLLPIIQRLMQTVRLGKNNGSDTTDHALHRDSGLFAIILAPTRELCKQISVVLEKLLYCANYIVAGTVIGGEKKKSEKARLRKGLNLLVATPGRLVDHLANTETLDVSRVRYLVLDEGDRLMEMGFEEDITKIVRTLDSKKRKCPRPGLPERRITMLCSATLKMNVQKLGDISLKEAVHIKGDSSADTPTDTATEQGEMDDMFLAPAQLQQSYIVSAAKLRLVTLVALLRRTFARKGSVMKAIVFVSCADSVEFHFKTLTRTNDNEAGPRTLLSPPASPDPQTGDSIARGPLLSSEDNAVHIYKLHGSLPQAVRTSIVKAFAAAATPSLLIATDVASRGLDLPNLDLVIEYDPAFSTADHLHRIGRTARLGRDGRAIIFLLPGKEELYVDVLKNSYRKTDATTLSSVTSTPAEEILRKGFTPKSGLSNGKEWEQKATALQLELERNIIADATYKELAKKAFQSHIRAYATHIASERQYFDIKELHLGHLAKSFGLRDPPGRVHVAGMRNGKHARQHAPSRARTDPADRGREQNGDQIVDIGDADDAARRMKDKVRNRKKMMGGGADEFNLA